MISKNKPQKGRIGTAYHVEKAWKHKKVNCQHYDQEDGSCYAKSVILWQIGYDICDKCKQKMPLDDEEDDTSKVKKTKKNKKTNRNRSKVEIYKLDNDTEIEKRRRVRKSSRSDEVLKLANNYCELCGKHADCLDICVIDKNKSLEDIDSIFNIVAVCLECKSKIKKNRKQYLKKMKKIVDERLDKLV